jgi:gliding motility-associated-like protein
LDVIVHPVPTVNQPTNVLVQNGTATPQVIFTGAVSPTTYAWTSTNTSFGLPASGTGNIASFTANYTGGGNVQQVVSTIVVTPSANGCVGTAKTFTFTLNLNAAPTNISLSKANLFEANAIGATVGNLSSTDPDAGDTHTYSLVGGSGGGDNASFTIVGNQLKANAVFNFAAKRLYAVRIGTTDAGGLSFEKEFLISISKTPIVLGTGNVPSTKKQTAASANPAISKGYASYLTVTGENLTGYSWSPGTGLSANNIANPVASPAQTTTYNVTVTNSFGSTTVVPITITVLLDYNVTPNNLLTPNGDGINDTWAIENIASYPNNEVKIVDKAGRIVFTQKGYSNTWDGANLIPDTYYYIIIFGPDVAPKKGFITIIR